MNARVRHSVTAKSFAALTLAVCLIGPPGSRAGAQSHPPGHIPEHGVPDHGVVADDDLTRVIGTRFVANTQPDKSPKSQFLEARIPVSDFNTADHCIDQEGLELARQYFDSLGRMLGKAGQFYIVPDADMATVEATCVRQTGEPPHAWKASSVKLIAFGQVVPTTEAAALEAAIR